MVKHSKYVPTDKDARKDRESGDAKTTMFQPAKKQGAGGSYTWTGSENGVAVEDTVFMTGMGTETPQNKKSSRNLSASAPTSPTTGKNKNSIFVLDQRDFPNLVAKSGADSPMRRAQKARWEMSVALDKEFNLAH